MAYGYTTLCQDVLGIQVPGQARPLRLRPPPSLRFLNLSEKMVDPVGSPAQQPLLPIMPNLTIGFTAVANCNDIDEMIVVRDSINDTPLAYANAP